MNSLKHFHTTMMNEAFLKDDENLANTHYQALIRLDDFIGDAYLHNTNRYSTDAIDYRKESMKCYTNHTVPVSYTHLTLPTIYSV